MVPPAPAAGIATVTFGPTVAVAAVTVVVAAVRANAPVPIPDVAAICAVVVPLTAPKPSGNDTVIVSPAACVSAVLIWKVRVYVALVLIVRLVEDTVGTLIALAIGATIRLLSMARVTATPNILDNLFFIDLLFFLLGFYLAPLPEHH
jgi:hypothetical protein